jgi:hypothetical protein
LISLNLENFPLKRNILKIFLHRAVIADDNCGIAYSRVSIRKMDAIVKEYSRY